MQVAEEGIAARYFTELEALLRQEWPRLQAVRGNGGTVPEPLVALTPDHALAGGLAFLEAESPMGEGRALWVNALLIAPAYRRQRVASLLIQAAQDAARRSGATHLHALTEVPDLYRKQGWQVTRQSGIDFVMTRNLG